MGKKSEYEIVFSSLQDGKHEYHYKIGSEFFENFDYTDIEGADLILDVSLEKKPDMMIATFDVKGSLQVMCDLCTDSFSYPIEGNDDVIYKFSETEIDDEKIICVLPNEFEIDITMPIYEFIALLLPAKRVHPEGKCNQKMLEEIDKYLMVESDSIEKTETDSTDDDNEIDPRWSKLKDLK